jgi:hypothetical protein
MNEYIANFATLEVQFLVVRNSIESQEFKAKLGSPYRSMEILKINGLLKAKGYTGFLNLRGLGNLVPTLAKVKVS